MDLGRLDKVDQLPRLLQEARQRAFEQDPREPVLQQEPRVRADREGGDLRKHADRAAAERGLVALLQRGEVVGQRFDGAIGGDPAERQAAARRHATRQEVEQLLVVALEQMRAQLRQAFAVRVHLQVLLPRPAQHLGEACIELERGVVVELLDACEPDPAPVPLAAHAGQQ